ncbi:CDP-diacylglycerol--inositol 3-phosphatidyltransferase [Basidiobolus meristosporus CBS 931.73]|uniref:CDP-diacylglycerol--inositol 3-phosphatidyltransferase n=1 Tax=Basidiobolus meristosporus CBS 931.73 TaxID=1314790 RepID=A0A1Y1Z6S4_9FUNG|nr:CDP-diacylglycerol--inositol 3-phosphatidyltransferase [Basidiobolus meristosporus CBS 931.73]|eukprot:ORY05959.1 CDP-diacylglycerol--inositol 3-phosphatidyltransferase [Basidiobolus meristosporus CBS 931.73]
MASKQQENVFLFVPNIIGYSRIVLAAISLYYMPDAPVFCVALYSLSCLLDAVDGQAARYFGQCSKFGAVLDMVTDRCTTTCLMCYLAQVYPKWSLLFQFLISLDLSSHYMHMYSTLSSGVSSHKVISKKQNFILRAYYSNNLVLFSFCAGNELFFIFLYILAFYTGPEVFNVAGVSVSLIHILAFLTFPICAIKQIINCIQFGGAAKTLAKIDLEERQKAAKQQ